MEQIKYFRIIIDRHLKSDNQIEELTSSIESLIYKFYLLREIFSKNFTIFYKPLVEFIWRYGFLVWGGLYETNLKPLEVTQNNILKIIFLKPRLYHTSLLYTNKMLNIRCLNILTVSTYMRKLTGLMFMTHKYEKRNNIQILFLVMVYQ